MLQNNIIDNLIIKIKQLLQHKPFVLIAIDGRCGAGKTTLAKELQSRLSCNVVHMDDFFLRPEQRTAQRLETHGENVDHERFRQEVLIPLSQNRAFSYRPYSCSKQAFAEPVNVQPCPVSIVEGSYSCHNSLWDYYDLHLFLDVDSETQLQRIAARNGKEAAEVFKTKWIPLEESYFKAYSIKERCELKIPCNLL